VPTNRRGHGLSFVAQHFAGSPHRPDFTSTALLPGDSFEETIVFELSPDPSEPIASKG
jgi:hypothetical protein